jgi:hypothetical protein
MELIRQYEEVRAQALGEAITFGAGRGLAVLLHRGLVTWLALCQELLAGGEQRSRALAASSAGRTPLPPGVRGEIVRTLASMVFAAQQEGA